MKKKVLIITTIILLVLIATFGASVALFSRVLNSNGNVISFNSANFKFKYTELTANGINIDDAEPISDQDGKILENYFEFKIEASHVYEDFDYEIVLEELSNNSIPHDIVKLYLSEVINDVEIPVNYTFNDDGSIKTLNDYYDTQTINQTGKTIYSQRLKRGTVSYERIFRLRAFIKDGISLDDIAYMNTETSFRINVFVNDKVNGCEYPKGYTWNFDYLTDGQPNLALQEFSAPCDGNYKIELWGASGGTGKYSSYANVETGGSGSYTSGDIELTQDEKLYLAVGGRGVDATAANQHISIAGGYNGGGNGVSGGTDDQAASAGGATDVRILNGDWNDAESLNSRIMVAAGGGGGHSYVNSNVDVRTAYPAINGLGLQFSGTIGQWSGGTRSATISQTSGGNFGSGTAYSSLEGTHGAGGGGGGWYGGTANTNGAGGPGTGGTSYISGHAGCVAVSSKNSSTAKSNCTTGTTDISCSISPYNYQFKNTVMIDGAGYSWTNEKDSLEQMPNPDDGYYDEGVGHVGNGHVRITYLSNNISKIKITSTLIGRRISIKATDNKNIVAYAVDSVTNIAPSFTEVTPTTKLDITTNVFEPGNYYIWIKDEDDNILKRQVIIPQSQSACEYAIGTEWDYDYDKNDFQEFSSTCSGVFKVELWGASGGNGVTSAGGNGFCTGGSGAYTSGYLELVQDSSILINVGGKGQNAVLKTAYKAGGYNGGGTAGNGGSDDSAGSGGGATDIRISESLNSRIMVAAGGGGASCINNASLTDVSYRNGAGLLNPSQAIAGWSYSCTVPEINQTSTSFGLGVNAPNVEKSHAAGGGGGGWYGGTYCNGNNHYSGAQGGTSYISGHTGCVAVTSANDATPKAGCVTGTTDNDCSISYSEYTFIDTKMIDGSGYSWTTTRGTQENMPNPDGGYYNKGTGHTGNGHARITYIGSFDDAPVIKTSLSARKIKISATGASKLIAYAVSAEKSEPNYISIVPTYVFSELTSTLSPGTYYVWIKDINNRVVTKKVVIPNNSPACEYSANYVWNFNYIGDYDVFKVPCSGNYKIELWGAQGGTGATSGTTYLGGYGSYTSGEINLTEHRNLYIYVGGQGENHGYNTSALAKGGWNGGGAGGDDKSSSSDSDSGGGGGGATDISLTEGNVIYNSSTKMYTRSQDSYASRIMVAAGGGGGNWNTVNPGQGANGGGLKIQGYTLYHGTTAYTVSKGSQTEGYAFGYADSGSLMVNGDSKAGGGAGYYSGVNPSWGGQGAGGTSYISGHTGCVAVKAIDDITAKEGCVTGTTDNSCSIHYSDLSFTNTVMIDGSGYSWSNVIGSRQAMPNPEGGTFATGIGKKGNGYARITYLGN